VWECSEGQTDRQVRAVVWECSEGQTDRQTDSQAAVTNIHFASAMPHAKCNEF